MNGSASQGLGALAAIGIVSWLVSHFLEILILVLLIVMWISITRRQRRLAERIELLGSMVEDALIGPEDPQDDDLP